MDNEAVSPKLYFWFKVFCVVFVSILCFRFDFTNRISGLDPSWSMFLNLAFHDGLKFGHGLIFTYGPLGWLCTTRSIGSNAVLAFWFWLAVAVSGAVMASYVMFSDTMQRFSSRKANVLLSMIMLYCGMCWPGRFNHDYIFPLFVMSLLAVCWHTGELKFFVMASLVSSFSFFVKFSSCAMCFMFLSVFAVSVFLRNGGGVSI